ncbi:hypothetical protein [Streptomyces sp. WM6378]|uniref:hypothetical protein n=1 Tax=Streptomyces sp. WM6378 TaxID=1415557 RepID=UPI00131C606F|nr:hypothetical protein [Streptomyces sp. WM6378]
MTDDSTRPATLRTRSKTILAVVLAISIAGLVWAAAWHFLGWHYWGIAWLASKAAVKAVLLGPPLVAGVIIWLRQRYKKPTPPHPEDEQQT